VTLTAPAELNQDDQVTPGDAGKKTVQRLHNALSALRLFAILLIVALLSTFIVVVPIGERGVLLRFGAVQDTVLGEGIHLLPPAIYSVKSISVRIESHQQKSEAATRDLQDIKIDLAVQWHLPPDHIQRVYQNLGDSQEIVSKVLDPAVEDSLKTIVASLTAEQLITERTSFHQELEQLLSDRLATFGLALDGVDLIQLDFSDRFRAAVEAKQVAEQDARRAAYEAARAQRQAAARVYQAEGEAKAQELLQNGLTAQLLQRQAIEKWDGKLPLVVSNDNLPLINLQDLLKADRKRQQRS
jgi:regulator of protease activity HflC (stomatin/prohibitin superfamily)